MSNENVLNQIKAGNLSLSELQEMFPESLAGSNVSASGWEVCYSSATGQLSEYATVTSNDSADPITGLGMIAYTANGSTMLCLQYSNGFSSQQIETSVGTTLYNPSMGNQVLCVIYGWTTQGNFFLSQTMTVGSC